MGLSKREQVARVHDCFINGIFGSTSL